MRPTIEKYLPELDQIKKIRDSLKECKDEWLETKPGGKGKPGSKYMGVNTVRQILDNAVSGMTYWDFGLIEQWKEEVYKYDKDNTKTWLFDGYVYHVRGYLFIPGLGHREQYGCKIAIGGKDNQDSAYKAAASNVLVKAASLFGVGESIYSKIKVETEADYEQSQYDQMQQSGQYQFQQQPQYGQQQGFQQQQQDFQQGYQQPQGGFQAPQDQYAQPQQQGFGQPYFDPNQQQSYFQPTPEQQQQFQQPQQGFAGQQPFGQPQQQGNWAQDMNNEANGTFNQAPELHEDEYPFNPHEPNTPAANAWDQRNMPQQPVSAQEQPFKATPQAEAQPQAFQAEPAQPVGAPVQTQQQQPAATPAPEEPKPSAIPAQWDQIEIQKIHQHRARLGIKTDNDILPYLREFLKKDDAIPADLVPGNLAEFNIFLEKFAA